MGIFILLCLLLSILHDLSLKLSMLPSWSWIEFLFIFFFSLLILMDHEIRFDSVGIGWLRVVLSLVRMGCVDGVLY